MRVIATKELQHISGGYTPPFNPDSEPFRAGIANWGGYANYYLNDTLGVDITGDNVFYNKMLGTGLALSGILASIPLVVSHPILSFSLLFGAGIAITLRYS